MISTSFRHFRLVGIAVVLVGAGAVAGLQRTTDVYSYRITGRVVTGTGSGVAGATIIVVLPEDLRDHTTNAGDIVVRYYRTEANGRFVIEESSSAAADERIIYVVKGIESVSPISPPFDEIADHDGRYNGQIVRIKRNDEIDVGNIQVQVSYGVVTIEWASGLLASDRGTCRSGRAFIRITDPAGNRLRELLLADAPVVGQHFRVSLPEGTWGMAVVCRDGEYAERDLGPITVSPDSDVIVQMDSAIWNRPGKRYQRVTPSQARHKLVSRGLQFTNENFLQAVEKDNADVVDLFLAGAMSPNVSGQDGVTALMMAAAGCRDDIVRALLQYGADPNASAADGASALIVAAGACDSETTTRLLLAAGANVNRRSGMGLTPLITAAANGKRRVVKLLLSSGANPFVRDEKGMTALDWAVRGEHKDVIELLGGR